MKKTNTIALVVQKDDEGIALKEALHDESEIQLFQHSYEHGSKAPLEEVYQFRAEKIQKEDEFADYVENLLEKPFLKKEVQENAIEWFKSRIKIENYQKTENESAKIIAQYAYQIFQANRVQKEFLLEGQKTAIQIRVFVVPNYGSSI